MAALGQHPAALSPRNRGCLFGKGDDEAAGERLAGVRRRQAATASRCAGRVHGRVCARRAPPMWLMRQLDMGREVVHTWACQGAVGLARVVRLGRCPRPGPIALISGSVAAYSRLSVGLSLYVHMIIVCVDDEYTRDGGWIHRFLDKILYKNATTIAGRGVHFRRLCLSDGLAVPSFAANPSLSRC